MIACKDSGGWSNSADHAAAGYMIPVGFAQNQRDEVRMMTVAGALAAEPGAKQQTYVAQPIAFPERMSGTQCASTENLAPAMGALNPTAVAVSLRGREGGATAELGDEVGNCLRASGGGGDKAHVLASMQVRRLTPAECEALQGFPRDYTLIPIGKKMAADGQRYKALGNSWAVPNARWIGQRLQAVADIPKTNSKQPASALG